MLESLTAGRVNESRVTVISFEIFLFVIRCMLFYMTVKIILGHDILLLNKNILNAIQALLKLSKINCKL